MASTNTSQPQLLSIEELNAIRTNHKATANAIEKIVRYINTNLTPSQGKQGGSSVILREYDETDLDRVTGMHKDPV